MRREGELERAAEVLLPATRSGGNDSRARALTAIGQVHAAAGRGPEALAAFNAAVDLAELSSRKDHMVAMGSKAPAGEVLKPVPPALPAQTARVGRSLRKALTGLD